MRAIYRALMSIIACGLFGAAYGATAGAVFGTLPLLVAGPLALIGAMVGFVLGSLYGLIAGIVGGSLGGPVGWCIGGLIGGVIPPLLLMLGDTQGRPAHAHVDPSGLWLFLLPILIGAALGLAVGRDLQKELPSLPAVRWLRGITSPCLVGEWLWWRHGGSDSCLNPSDTTRTEYPFPLPSTPVRWVIALCLGGVLLFTKSCHDDLSRRSRPSIRFLIPSGYVGWVMVQFGVSGAPPLSTEGDFYLVRVPPGGVCKTSTSIKACGLARDEFYAVSGAHRQLLKSSGMPGDGSMVWSWGAGCGEGSAQSVGQPPVKTAFLFHYIGTEAQFHRKLPPPPFPRPE